MISCQQRQPLLTLTGPSRDCGARLQTACALIELDARAVERWQRTGIQQGEPRAGNERRITVPPHKFSKAKGQAALKAVTSEQFKSLPSSPARPHHAWLTRAGLWPVGQPCTGLLREVAQGTTGQLADWSW